MTALTRLTAIAAAKQIESGALTAVHLAQAYIESIRSRNPEIEAYLAWDEAKILQEARMADAMPASKILRGLPYAVKDVIETANYPTTYGSPIYRDHTGERDAGVIVRAREEGAVLLGKLATGEFATQTPGRARNPLNPDHTPGGSSSGSGAAVGGEMALMAFGTQTTASIIRPAVYCGIVGYKPSYGLLPTTGVSQLSPTQDTVGMLTRTVEDAALFTGGLHGYRLSCDSVTSPRIGVLESSQWQYASPETVAAIERLAKKLENAGAIISRWKLPAMFESLVDDQARLVAYDGRHSLAHERVRHHELLSRRLQDRLASGLEMSLPEYLDVLQRVSAARLAMTSFLSDVDVMLYPATEAEAERGLESSGSPRFGALWSLMHNPCVSFPTENGPGGLPLGVQVIGRYGDDFKVLSIARMASALSSGQTSV